MCPDLPPGRYLIAASPADIYKHGPGRGSHPTSVTFYPGTADIDEAIAIRIAGGRWIQANFSLQIAPTFHVQGSLPNGAKEAAISVATADSVGYRIELIDFIDYQINANHFFLEGLPSGNYRVNVTWLTPTSGRSFKGHSASILIVVAGTDVDDVHLEDDSIAFVHADVTLDGENNALPPDVAVFLVRTDGFAEEIGGTVGPDHHVLFQNVVPGEYTVRFNTGLGAYLKSIAQKGILSDAEVVTLPSGSQEAYLVIKLGSQLGTILGMVKTSDGKQERAAVVAKSVGSGRLYLASTDANGQYVFTGLGPGVYRLYAWHSLDDVAYADPHTLVTYAPDAKEVTLSEGSSQGGIDLQAIPQER